MPTESPFAKLNPTFCRRLIVAHLIDTLDRPSVPALMRVAGWPRGTLHDIIKALASWGINAEFIQDGVRNNDGYYRLSDWGAYNPSWVKQHWPAICSAVDLKLPA